MNASEIAALANLAAQLVQMAMTYYASQGKVPTLEEITANYVEIQALIEAEKVK
jgi:hypothetical protein